MLAVFYSSTDKRYMVANTLTGIVLTDRRGKPKMFRNARRATRFMRKREQTLTDTINKLMR